MNNYVNDFWNALNYRTSYFSDMKYAEKEAYIMNIIRISNNCDVFILAPLFELLAIIIKTAPKNLKNTIAEAIIDKSEKCLTSPQIISSFCNAAEIISQEISLKNRQMLLESLSLIKKEYKDTVLNETLIQTIEFIKQYKICQ